MFGEEVAEGEITDIEELLQSGRDRGLCAFYLARELQYSADIIFAPYVPCHHTCCVSYTNLRVLCDACSRGVVHSYNYLIDPAIRRSLGVDLRGAVIIFDEAHNVESVCEDSASFDLRVADMKVAIKELERAAELAASPSYSGETNKDDITRFKGTSCCCGCASHYAFPSMMADIISCLWSIGMVWALINDINKVHVSGDGFTRPGDYIYELLNQVLIFAPAGKGLWVGTDHGVGARWTSMRTRQWPSRTSATAFLLIWQTVTPALSPCGGFLRSRLMLTSHQTRRVEWV
jgi:regulator of telomere elongation helicase 1